MSTSKMAAMRRKTTVGAGPRRSSITKLGPVPLTASFASPTIRNIPNGIRRMATSVNSAPFQGVDGPVSKTGTFKRRGSKELRDLIQRNSFQMRRRKHSFRRLVRGRDGTTWGVDFLGNSIDTNQSDSSRNQNDSTNSSASIKWVIKPRGTWKIRWDIYIGLIIAYSAILIPYRISFDKDLVGWERVMNYFFDSSFGVDIVLNFFTGFYDGDVFIHDLPRIRWRYVKSWFVFDLLATVPIDTIVQDLTDGDNSFLSLKLFRVIRLFRLLKMMRLLRLKRAAQSFHMEMINDQVIQTIKSLIGICFVLHLVACGWYMLYTWDPSRMNWVTYLMGENGSYSYPYLVSMYWVASTMMSVGYGDIVGVTDYERIYSILAMCLGSVCVGLLIGNIQMLTENFNPRTIKMKAKLAETKEFLFIRGVPRRIRLKVMSQFEFHWGRRSVFDEEEFLKSFPKGLQYEILLASMQGLLEKYPFFGTTTIDFFVAVTPRLRPVYLPPHQTLVEAESVWEELYFVMDGSVESLDGNIIAGTLSPGDICGIEVLVNEKKRYTHTYRSIEKSELYALDTVVLINAMKNCPSATSCLHDFARILQERYHDAAKRNKRAIQKNLRASFHCVIRPPEITQAIHDVQKARRGSSMSRIGLGLPIVSSVMPLLDPIRKSASVPSLTQETMALALVSPPQQPSPISPSTEAQQEAISAASTVETQRSVASTNQQPTNSTSSTTVTGSSSAQAQSPTHPPPLRSSKSRGKLERMNSTSRIQTPIPENEEMTDKGVLLKKSQSARGIKNLLKPTTPSGNVLERRLSKSNLQINTKLDPNEEKKEKSEEDGPNSRKSSRASSALAGSTFLDSNDGRRTTISRKRPSTMQFQMHELQRFQMAMSEEMSSHWSVIRHYSKTRVSWDILLAFFVLTSAFTIPYRICFDAPDTMFHFVLDRMSDVLFFCDLVLNFFTSYVDDMGVEVVGLHDIRRHYLRTSFLIDLVSTIPFDYTIENVLPKSSASFRSLKLLRTVKLIKLLRLLRLLKLLKLSSLGDSELELNMDMMKLLKVIAPVATVAHYVGCFWYYISSDCDPENAWWGNVYFDRPNSTLSKYIAAVYWATTTMVTVGYGDIYAVNPREKAFSILVMVGGANIFAYVIGTVLDVVTNSNSLLGREQQRITEIAAYVKERGVCKEFRNSCEEHLRFVNAEKTFYDQQVILEALTYALKSELILLLNERVLSQFRLFEKKPKWFLTLLLRRLEPQFFLAGELIIYSNNPSYGIYFLVSGLVIAKPAANTSTSASMHSNGRAEEAPKDANGAACNGITSSNHNPTSPTSSLHDPARRASAIRMIGDSSPTSPKRAAAHGRRLSAHFNMEGSRIIVATVYPGDVFGYREVLGKKNALHDVFAAKASATYMLPREFFDEIESNFPSVAKEVHHLMMISIDKQQKLAKRWNCDVMGYSEHSFADFTPSTTVPTKAATVVPMPGHESLAVGSVARPVGHKVQPLPDNPAKASNLSKVAPYQDAR